MAIFKPSTPKPKRPKREPRSNLTGYRYRVKMPPLSSVVPSAKWKSETAELLEQGAVGRGPGANEFYPEWIDHVKNRRLRQHLQRTLDMVERRYPDADPLLLRRIVWVERLTNRVEFAMAKAEGVLSETGGGNGKAPTALSTRYLQLVEMMVDLLRRAGPPSMERAPWRRAVVLPEDDDGTE